MSTLPKVEYFTGTSEELGKLKEEVNAFMEEVKPAGYNIGHAFSWETEQGYWRIIVAVVYQEQLPQRTLGIGHGLAIPPVPRVH